MAPYLMDAASSSSPRRIRVTHTGSAPFRPAISVDRRPPLAAERVAAVVFAPQLKRWPEPHCLLVSGAGRRTPPQLCFTHINRVDRLMPSSRVAGCQQPDPPSPAALLCFHSGLGPCSGLVAIVRILRLRLFIFFMDLIYFRAGFQVQVQVQVKR